MTPGIGAGPILRLLVLVVVLVVVVESLGFSPLWLRQRGRRRQRRRFGPATVAKTRSHALPRLAA